MDLIAQKEGTMTERQTWAVIALLACVFVGGAVYLGVDLPAVGRAVLWLVDVFNRITSMM